MTNAEKLRILVDVYEKELAPQAIADLRRIADELEFQEGVKEITEWAEKLPSSRALKQLINHQEQLDHDGIMVGVSRQALEDVILEFQRIEKTLDDLYSGKTAVLPPPPKE